MTTIIAHPKYEPTKAEKKVLELIMRKGEITQAQLIDHTGINQQFLSRLVNGLQEKGLVRKGKKIQNGKRGQPSVSIEATPDYLYSVGVCIISGSVTLALVDFSGQVKEESLHYLKNMSRTAVLDVINSTIDSYVKKYKLKKSSLAGIGVGISGYAIGEGAKFNPTAPLDEWALVDIEEIISESTGLNTWAENDGNVAALGENMRGVGRWADNFAYLHLTYGFGGGLIISGKLMRGTIGNAGEFGGAVPVNSYKVSLEGLRREVNGYGNKFKNVNDLVNNFDIDLPGVNDWVYFVKNTLMELFRIISSIVDPEAIVLGGQLPKELAQRLIEETKLDEFTRRGLTITRPKVVCAESVGDPAAVGAGMLPIMKQYFE